MVEEGHVNETTAVVTSKQTEQIHPKSTFVVLLKKVTSRNVLVSIGLGQLLSLLICGTAVTSGLLQQEGVIIPTGQSFLNYVLLSLVYTSILACRSGEQNILKVLRHRGWKYILLALIDVEANYLIVKAYHYTTVTSVQLLDCFTIPTVLVLSWLILRVRYELLHVLGVGICLLGVGSLVGGDILVDKFQGEGSNHVLGDMLCLAGAALYGISNVAQEFVVKNYSSTEFLGMIGLFGSIINGVQFAVLERSEVMHIDWGSYKVLLPLIGYALCIFSLYSLMPLVIKQTSAAAVNLNLLSADFYAILVGLFIFHYKFHFLYFIAFACIIVGICLYSAKSPPTDTMCPADYREMHTGQPVVDQEAAPSSVPPSPSAISEITYHTTPSTPNGNTNEDAAIHVSKYIPPPCDSEEQKNVKLQLENNKKL